MKNKGLIFFAATTMSLFSIDSFAADGCTPSTTRISVPNLVIPKDFPIGALIGTYDSGSQTIYTRCNGTFLNNYKKIVAVKSYGTYHSQVGNRRVYQIGTTGIGYAIAGSISSVSNHSCVPLNTYVYVGEDSSGTGGDDLALICKTQSSNAESVVKGSFQIELYKVGEIQTASLVGRKIGAGAFQYEGYGGWDAEAPINIDTINVLVPGCTVEAAQIDFPMNDVFLSEFSGVGSVSSSTVTRSLELTCDADVNVSVKLEGTPADEVSNNSVLALTGEGSAGIASGIGVQLVYNDVPLILNEDLSLKQTEGGREIFPITARYYQTKAQLSEGKADAIATLSVSYQ